MALTARLRLALPGVPLAALLLGGLFWAGAAQALPSNSVDNKCAKCHTEFKSMTNVVAGEFQSLANKSQTFQVEVGDQKLVIKFTPETKVVNVPALKDLKKPIPVLVEFKPQGADMVAVQIKAKPVIKVPENQIVSLEQMQALVAQGPAKGGYTLIDSRPPGGFQEGHLPGAINIPFATMADMMDKLPKDKAAQIIFYCAGYR